jgi:hypothetical protein
MSRGQQTFRQRDATKLIKATLKAGLTVERVEGDKDGKIIIVTTKAKDAGNGNNPAENNEWDGVLQ